MKLTINKHVTQITIDRGDAASVDKCMTIPHVHANRIKTKFFTSTKNIKEVLRITKDITPEHYDRLPQSIQQIMVDQHNQTIATQALLEYGPTETPDPSAAGPTLMVHQQLGREIAKYNDRYGFFYSTRTGKTLMSLQIIVDDLKVNPDNKWLILCPLILIDNAWLEDAAKFFPELNIISLHDKNKAKRLAKFDCKANVYVQNIESFVSYKEHIDKLDITGVFVDESSTMKSPSSKFAKAAVEYSQTVDRWYLLSGTPAPNTEAEYYMQLRSIDYYAVPSSNTKFEQYFFDNISYNPQYKKLKLKENKQDEFNTLLRSMSMYVDSEDVLDLPGRKFETVDIDMPADVKEAYKSMRDQLVLELDGEDNCVTALSAAAKVNKLRQISSGFIYDEDRNTTLISDYKFVALLNLLKDIGDKQVLIWANYRYEFEMLQHMLGDKCAIINGAVDITAKNKAIADFKANKIQYLLANAASLDKGVTLTNAHTCIYFSMDYSYERYEQSIARIYGGKHSQPNFCTYYVMQVKGSVEPMIYNCVSNKQDASKQVLAHIRWALD